VIIEHSIQKQTRLADVAGPITARKAFAAADEAARSYDADALCHLLTAGERINHEGASDLWELLFLFPNERARAIFGVGIDEDCDPDEEWKLRYLFEDVQPFVPAEPEGILGRLLRSGAFDIKGRWRREVESRPPLPAPFRDSPEAVRALPVQGEDFVSGDTHLTLEARMLATGEAAWWSMAYGVEYTTPFAAG